MKKIYILFLVIFSLFISVDLSAATYKFIWDESTTYIDVPLGSNINQYKDIPKAYLYINGELKSDAEISYLTAGDWLYLMTDVNTSIVGEYKVWYKAQESKYCPGQCEGYKTLITFNVIDNIPPVISHISSELTYLIGGEKPDYLKHVVASDNSGKCNVTIDDSGVVYNVVGSYDVNVRVDDGYNIVNEKIVLNVKDPIGPIVTFLGENNTIKINKGENVDLKSYFKAIDNTDGDVINSISYPKFDTDAENEFSLEVTFSDNNGNKTSIVIDIKIIDENVPVINLYSENLILEYGSDYLSQIKSNIKEAYLGNKSIVEEVNIDLSNFKEEVGNYNIIYSYTHKDKTISYSVGVNVLSSKAPVLIIENFDSLIGEKPDYLSHVQALDNSDPLINQKVEINDNGVDYYTAGRYSVTVSVVNSSGLSKTETLYVNIINEEGNSILGVDNNIEENNIFILGIGVIGLVVIIIFWYNKKRKKLKD